MASPCSHFIIPLTSDLRRTSNWNGQHQSKSYGFKTLFGISNETRAVRKNITEKGELDMPPLVKNCAELFGRRIPHLVQTISSSSIPNIGKMINILREFVPNECNANSYCRDKGEYLCPHFDDRELSGPLLLNLSLAGVGKMTYTRTGHDDVVVDLPRRCLQIVMLDARYKWMHSINATHILDPRRVSLTWRQAGKSVRPVKI